MNWEMASNFAIVGAIASGVIGIHMLFIYIKSKRSETHTNTEVEQ